VRLFTYFSARQSNNWKAPFDTDTDTDSDSDPDFITFSGSQRYNEWKVHISHFPALSHWATVEAFPNTGELDNGVDAYPQRFRTGLRLKRPYQGLI
jgi:hypothetical protein